jgi:hypothetical protein
MPQTCVACAAEIFPGDRRCRLCSRLTAGLQGAVSPPGPIAPRAGPNNPPSPTSGQTATGSPGSTQVAAAQNPANLETNCTDCGSKVLPGFRFCQICGRALANVAANGSSPAATVPSAGTIDSCSTASAGIPAMPTGPTQSASAAGWAAPAQAPQRQPAYSSSQYRPAPGTLGKKPAPKGPRSGFITALVTILVFSFVGWALDRHSANRAGREAAPQPASRPLIGPGEQDFGEEGAIVVTPFNQAAGVVVTRTFPLSSDASFSIANPYGDIIIDTWDQEQAEVKVVKFGARQDVKARCQIVFSGGDHNLQIRCLAGGLGARFYVTLPSRLSNLEIKAGSGSVSVSQVRADISASAEDGAIDLTGVKGTATLETQTGDINSSFDEVHGDKPLQFVVNRGGIKLHFKQALDADLRAQTARGNISIEGRFGVGPRSGVVVDHGKGAVGAEASGRIGSGGRVLQITAEDGDISISK